MKNIETLIARQNQLSQDTAEARNNVAKITEGGVESLAAVNKLQKANVALLDLEIKVAENAIEICNAQQAECPAELENARFDLDESVAEVCELLAKAGITADQMPSAGIDPAAAERQFINGHVMVSRICVEAKAKLAEIEAFRRQAKSTMQRLETNLSVAKSAKLKFFARLTSQI